MNKVLLVLLVFIVQLFAKDTLIFGAISTEKVTKTKSQLDPFIKYLEQETGKTIVFKTGKDYNETIEQFSNGDYDFGYIGPSPYITANKNNSLNILAGLETNSNPYFYGVIVARAEDSSINSIKDLKGKNFAFGSRESTLSFYMPVYALMQDGVVDTLGSYEYLGKHDKVALSIIQGHHDAGAMQETVANKYPKLKVIYKTEPVYDFMIVANKNLDKKLQDAIKKALLKLKDKEILENIKEGATGFIETNEDNYKSLKNVMEKVDSKYK